MEFEASLIEEARRRIAPWVIETPLMRLQKLDELLGCKVFLKLENLQNVGSFKIRGAMNAALSLGKDQLSKGIVTCSTGNHGRACAFAGKMLGAPVTVVIPFGAPEIKVQNIADLGAEIVRCPAIERFDIARGISAETGAAYIPPYDDWNVMAGQGTIGLEIAEQLPEVDTVVVPTSGGGLLSGVACAIRHALPDAKVIGAEPAVMPRYGASLAAGEPVEVPQTETIADALRSNHPGDKCFEVVRQCADDVVPVSEEGILRAQKLLLTEGCIFAEPSACIGIGALLDGALEVHADERVCFVVSGGNCSIEQLSALEKITV